jgi:glycosyltransferase involved in cell wall biosynthesis
MRIVITADPEIEVPPRLYGGIERVVDGLVRRFRARGHQVCLVAKAESECPADAFHPWPGASSLSASDSLRNGWALWKAVRVFQPDVIHSFSRIAYLTPLLRGGIPIVMSYQRDPTMRTVGLAVKLAAPRVLSFTGCSDYIANLGCRAGGHWESIPNFAEMDALRFSPAVAPDAPLVFLSRVEHIKGAHWAIEIARRTRQRLIIAGNHADAGPEGEYWREKIAPEIGREGSSMSARLTMRRRTNSWAKRGR